MRRVLAVSVIWYRVSGELPFLRCFHVDDEFRREVRGERAGDRVQTLFISF